MSAQHTPDLSPLEMELLEALQQLLIWEPRQKDEEEREAYAKAKAAIAKATGKEDE